MLCLNCYKEYDSSPYGLVCSKECANELAPKIKIIEYDFDIEDEDENGSIPPCPIQ